MIEKTQSISVVLVKQFLNISFDFPGLPIIHCHWFIGKHLDQGIPKFLIYFKTFTNIVFIESIY